MIRGGKITQVPNRQILKLLVVRIMRLSAGIFLGNASHGEVYLSTGGVGVNRESSEM